MMVIVIALTVLSGIVLVMFFDDFECMQYSNILMGMKVVARYVDVDGGEVDGRGVR